MMPKFALNAQGLLRALYHIPLIYTETLFTLQKGVGVVLSVII
jgi:hypothetical protein